MTRIEVARLRLPLTVDTVTGIARLLEDEHGVEETGTETRAHSEHVDGATWLVITAEDNR